MPTTKRKRIPSAPKAPARTNSARTNSARTIRRSYAKPTPALEEEAYTFDTVDELGYTDEEESASEEELEEELEESEEEEEEPAPVRAFTRPARGARTAPRPGLEHILHDASPEEYTAQSYRADRLIPLPSGKSIRVRPLSLSAMIRLGEEHGGLPNSLTAAANRMLYQGGTNKVSTEREKRDLLEVIDRIVCACVASFDVVLCLPGEEESEDELSVYAMSEADRTTIASYVMRGQQALATFRR